MCILSRLNSTLYYTTLHYIILFLQYFVFILKVLSRENWLSPVIQATWEARSVGWLEKEGSQRPGRMISVAALWPTCLGRPTEEVKLL